MDSRQQDRCGKCAQPLIWTITPSGAKAPICRDPSDKGNVLLLAPTGLRETLAVTLSGEALDQAKERNLRLRLNHYANCPAAEFYAEQAAARKKSKGKKGVKRG